MTEQHARKFEHIPLIEILKDEYDIRRLLKELAGDLVQLSVLRLSADTVRREVSHIAAQLARAKHDLSELRQLREWRLQWRAN